MPTAPKPDFSFQHNIGRNGLLVVDCYSAHTKDEVYVVTFETESVCFTAIDFDNYIDSLVRMRTQVKAEAALAAVPAAKG